MRLWVLAVFFVASLAAGPAGSVEKIDQFATPELDQRYHNLLKILRCQTCDGQSLEDSRAESAVDLRAKVYEQVVQGKSEAEILKYLVERYGEAVSNDPRFRPGTYVLWFAPLALLITVVLVLFRKVRINNQKDASLSAEEQQRLKILLADENNGASK